jgi:hypothetical protein
VLRIKKTNLVVAFSHAKESKEPARPSLSPLVLFLGQTGLTQQPPGHAPARSCEPRRAAVRPGEAEPRRGRDVPDGSPCTATSSPSAAVDLCVQI